MKPLKNKVGITLDEDVIERIKQLAEDDDRSFSQYINMVLKELSNLIIVIFYYQISLNPLKTLSLSQVSLLSAQFYLLHFGLPHLC